MSDQKLEIGTNSKGVLLRIGWKEITSIVGGLGIIAAGTIWQVRDTTVLLRNEIASFRKDMTYEIGKLSTSIDDLHMLIQHVSRDVEKNRERSLQNDKDIEVNEERYKHLDRRIDSLEKRK